MVRRSAAWVIGIVIILAVIMGALILTATDPIMQRLFDSTLWSSTSTEGSNALSWQKAAWAFFPTAILLALLIQVWVDTRQPT